MCLFDAVSDRAIAVVDDVVDVNAVTGELPEVWAATVRSEGSVPTGPGTVALLAGPGAEVTEAALDNLPDLRVVVVTSMGWDHVDADAARARGIAVIGVEPYCVDEVAEHTLALILDLLRGVTQLNATVREGRWEHSQVGRTVRGTTLGLVGLGRIGSAVAWRSAALGMDVLTFDPRIGLNELTERPAVRLAHSLGALVSESHVVSLHVPLASETRNLIDAQLLARFRPGSYLVNVSRGEIVTETALGEALREGRLAGAALDVLQSEPPAPDDPVIAFPRTVLTPHSAWYSPAAVERVSRSAGRVLAQWFDSAEHGR
jgi:D-3-phosphoglycerate dehydrogenase